MPGEEKDVIDKLMPDPEEEGGTNEELDIEIAEDDGQGVAIPEDEAEEETVDAGARPESEEDELEPEDKNYSKNVRDRILREKRLRRRQVESERIARTQAEARATAAEAGQIQASLFATGMIVKSLEGEIAYLESALVAAKEAGKSADEVKLGSKLADAQANLRESKANYTRLEAAKSTPTKPGVNPYQAAWLDKNTWFSDQSFEGDAAHARAIDKQLASSKKFSINSPEYFEELDRLIHEELPRLRVKAKNAGLRTSYDGRRTAPDPRTQRRASPVLAARQRQPGGEMSRSRTKVVLTKADLANMANFKLDPTNPKHLQEYARNKIAEGN